MSLLLEANHYRRTEGQQTLQRYLESTPRAERIEALFCENDILAIGAIDALVATHSQCRIAIIGFDDIELGSSPSYELTTFRQPIEYLVSEALRRIIDPDADELGSVMAPGTLDPEFTPQTVVGKASIALHARERFGPWMATRGC